MSISDWQTDYHYEVGCDRSGCGTLLSECLTWRQALEAMVENHDACRPTVVTIVRRGRTPAKKRWRWSVWLHRGPHAEAVAEAV